MDNAKGYQRNHPALYLAAQKANEHLRFFPECQQVEIRGGKLVKPRIIKR
jgi:hypothetical protein